MSEPINPTIMKQYRDVLETSGSPSYIDTTREIQPVVLVNSSAKPALVGIAERGTFVIKTALTAVTGTGVKTTTFLVPVGKVWTLKTYQSYINSGSFTPGTNTWAIDDDVATLTCGFNVASLPSANMVTTNLQVYGNQSIVITNNVAAFVASGDIQYIIGVQEFDA